MIFSFLDIFQVLHCAFLIFHVFECFLPYSRSKSFYVSFFTFFQFSCDIPGTIVCISHFSRLSIFLAIFHFLQCVFLIFHDFQFSCLIPGPTVCISHFLAFSVVFAIFQVLQYVFLIFHDFQFLPYSGHTVCISHFSLFSMFLAIFHFLQYVFLIFHDFLFSRLLQVLKCAFLIFHLFQCFSL